MGKRHVRVTAGGKKARKEGQRRVGLMDGKPGGITKGQLSYRPEGVKKELHRFHYEVKTCPWCKVKKKLSGVTNAPGHVCEKMRGGNDRSLSLAMEVLRT